jgi:hypothetical protein
MSAINDGPVVTLFISCGPCPWQEHVKDSPGGVDIADKCTYPTVNGRLIDLKDGCPAWCPLLARNIAHYTAHYLPPSRLLAQLLKK